ncbi:MAG TPA: hypothetical protein VIU61_16185 [Kofleriaceae bacterium]
MGKRDRLSPAESIFTVIGVAIYLLLATLPPRAGSDEQEWAVWSVVGAVTVIAFIVGYAIRRPTATTPRASGGWYLLPFVPWLASAIGGSIAVVVMRDGTTVPPYIVRQMVGVQSMMFFAGIAMALGLRRRRAEAALA